MILRDTLRTFDYHSDFQCHDGNENCSWSRRLSWNLRDDHRRVDRIRITPDWCLLASIKFPPFGELSLELSRFRSVSCCIRHDDDTRRDAVVNPGTKWKWKCWARAISSRYTVPLFHLLTSLQVLSCRSLFQPGDTELPPIYFLDRHGGSGSNPPCTTKWIPPAKKAAVCLPVTTRVVLISLAYIHLDLDSSLRRSVKCKYSRRLLWDRKISRKYGWYFQTCVYTHWYTQDKINMIRNRSAILTLFRYRFWMHDCLRNLCNINNNILEYAYKFSFSDLNRITISYSINIHYFNMRLWLDWQILWRERISLFRFYNNFKVIYFASKVYMA